MSADGRPIRFLAVVLGGWTAMRAAMLWPSIETPLDVIDAVVPGVARANPTSVTARIGTSSPAGSPKRSKWTNKSTSLARPVVRGSGPRRVAVAMLGLMHFGDAKPIALRGPVLRHARPGTESLPLAPRLSRAVRSRWSGSGWFVVRAGGRTGDAFGGSQLGGSQAGLRLAYTIDRSRRIALAGRVSTPLAGKGREAAIGLEWQPTSAPVRVIVEQRVSLNGRRGGPTVGLIGGVGPMSIARETSIEAYGQAGATAREGIETFADGAVRLAHGLFDIGRTQIDFGVGAWGAVQRGAARLDTGPSLSADVPIGRGAHARFSLDWRARIAGDARPGSGFVLTLGTDF